MNWLGLYVKREMKPTRTPVARHWTLSTSTMRTSSSLNGKPVQDLSLYMTGRRNLAFRLSVTFLKTSHHGGYLVPPPFCVRTLAVFSKFCGGRPRPACRLLVSSVEGHSSRACRITIRALLPFAEKDVNRTTASQIGPDLETKLVALASIVTKKQL